MNLLPKELIDRIYSFDMTYHEEYSKSIHRIKYTCLMNDLINWSCTWTYDLNVCEEPFYLAFFSMIGDVIEPVEVEDLINNGKMYEQID